MGRIEQIKERLDSELYVFTEHNNTYGHVNEFREAHEDIEYLLSRLQIAEEALKLISEEFSVIRSIGIAQQSLEQIQKEE